MERKSDTGIGSERHDNEAHFIVNLEAEAQERIRKAIRFPFSVARRVTRATPESMYLTGGFVRNLLAESPGPTDYDFMGEFDIEQIAADYAEFVVGKWDDIGTVRLRIGDATYDFISTADVRGTLESNDISISNMCIKHDGSVVDYVGGMDSLEQEEVKIENAEDKIKADPSRIIRAVRFAEQFGYSIEEETLRACRTHAGLVITSEFQWELGEVMNLAIPTRTKVYESLIRLGVFDDEYLAEYINDQRSPEIKRVEADLVGISPLERLAEIFPEHLLLAGGSVRDTIWSKNAKDIDVRVDIPIGQVVERLEGMGYERTTNIHLGGSQYYFNDRAQAVSIVIGGVDVDIASTQGESWQEMISGGDVNFSCCVYDVHQGRVLNPEVVDGIHAKQLRFANPDNARREPLIIMNALKQISKVPDIEIPDETLEIIKEALPMVVSFIGSNPELRYKAQGFCGNINSEQVLALFDGYDIEDIFEGLEMHKSCVDASSQYECLNTGAMRPDDRMALEALLKESYGASFDSAKMLSEKVNSVVVERDGERIVACCCMDGERIYSVAAVNGLTLIKMLRDIVRNNYNIWGTIDSSNTKMITIALMAGMRIEEDPLVVRKVLRYNDPKYSDDLRVLESDDLLAFDQEEGDDYPQVLVRN